MWSVFFKKIKPSHHRPGLFPALTGCYSTNNSISLYTHLSPPPPPPIPPPLFFLQMNAPLMIGSGILTMAGWDLETYSNTEVCLFSFVYLFILFIGFAFNPVGSRDRPMLVVRRARWTADGATMGEYQACGGGVCGGGGTKQCRRKNK